MVARGTAVRSFSFFSFMDIITIICIPCFLRFFYLLHNYRRLFVVLWVFLLYIVLDSYLFADSGRYHEADG